MAVQNSGRDTQLHGHVVPTLKKIRVGGSCGKLGLLEASWRGRLPAYLRVLMFWRKREEVEGAHQFCTIESLNILCNQNLLYHIEQREVIEHG